MNKRDDDGLLLKCKVGCKVVVSNKQGEVLFLRRSKATPRAGGWDFPGGGINEGEELEEGVAYPLECE